MSYTALYRKYRPDTFEDVKGQDHIVTTLKNQIRAGRIGHAYLFCGTRGTGKTTVAKVFARAVNCGHPEDGNPCGSCAVCRAIASGSSMNVVEIDAASNNGVDNIRQIREEVAYSPAEGRYRVYIIDEVHMLSIGAFNALLKTLEEPPPYVIFILATTEAHKIPVTILSRCQRYDFRRISVETIAERLHGLLRQEQVEAEDAAVRYIAKAADGSMRDALSLLDQCIAFYLGETLTYEHVLEVLGAADTEVFSRLLRAVLARDAAASVRILEEMVIQGREPGQFVTDFIWYLRNLLLIQSSDDMEDVLDMSAENLALLKEEADMTEPDVVMRYIRVFSELSGQLRYASQKRVLIEIALIRLCRPSMDSAQDALADRVASLEKQMENGIAAAAELQALRSKNAAGRAGADRTQAAAKAAPVIPKAIPEDIRQTVQNWRSVIQEMPGVVRSYLKSAHLSLGGDNKLMLVFDNDMAYTYVTEAGRRQEITDCISRRIGKEVELLFEKNAGEAPFEENYIDLEKVIHMEIEIEDE
ncbi:MAG: DNA polymerase III subunit gamma/tau [Lachnospiraceae bacterium]|nr:DNA polymerase III subunit gamma/tau [Lachnospiraceae bacterium]